MLQRAPGLRLSTLVFHCALQGPPLLPSLGMAPRSLPRGKDLGALVLSFFKFMPNIALLECKALLEP